MQEAKIEATRCPLCGESNQCGMARGETACWCFATIIPEAALAEIPNAARGRACLCPRCAGADKNPVEGSLPGSADLLVKKT